jgi:hypothetical protein
MDHEVVRAPPAQLKQSGKELRYWAMGEPLIGDAALHPALVRWL